MMGIGKKGGPAVRADFPGPPRAIVRRKVGQVGRYFGREPRYTRQEIEDQAKQEIEARVGLGRPPAEDWAPLEARLAEIEGQESPAPAPAPAPATPPAPAPAVAP